MSFASFFLVLHYINVRTGHAHLDFKPAQLCYLFNTVRCTKQLLDVCLFSLISQ